MGVTRKFEQLALPVSPLWGMNMCPGLTVNIYLFPLPCLLNQSKYSEPGYRDYYVMWVQLVDIPNSFRSFPQEEVPSHGLQR